MYDIGKESSRKQLDGAEKTRAAKGLRREDCVSLPFGDVTIWQDRALFSVSKALRMNLKT